MRICPQCEVRFASDDWQCPRCGARPPVIDGFPAFGGGPAQEAGFEERFFDALAEAEEENFWFASRTAIILDLVAAMAPSARTFLDAGCGTGLVLRALHEARPHLRLAGADPFIRGLEWARRRVPEAELIRSDVQSLPYDEMFDVVGAFDVLEHIRDDEAAIRALRRALKPGGLLLATVPQHRWLWSPADVIAHHERRYTRNELAGKLRRNAFRVTFATSFVSLLLPVMAASRRLRPRNGTAELVLPRFLNTAFRSVMRAEHVLIRAGVRFPAGGSLVVAAKREE